MKRVFVMAAAVVAMVGGDMATSTDTAGGRPYEIIVPIAENLWTGAVGDSLRVALADEVPMLPQVEPMFDLVRVRPNGVGDLLLRHRTMLYVSVNDTLSAPTSIARYDVYAAPQLVVSLSAPTAASLAEYIGASKAELRTLFETTERERAIKNGDVYGEDMLERDIENQFGVKLNIPKGYRRAVTAEDDWIWILNDNRTASQGIFIYSYPYGGANDFTASAMIARRNEISRRIETERPGAYMTVNTEAPIEMEYIRINGRPWAQMRSLWDVIGDAMGGPAITYATLDDNGENVITIDCYLYSPEMPKRNMYRALEHVVHSAIIDKKTEQ